MNRLIRGLSCGAIAGLIAAIALYTSDVGVIRTMILSTSMPLLYTAIATTKLVVITMMAGMIALSAVGALRLPIRLRNNGVSAARSVGIATYASAH